MAEKEHAVGGGHKKVLFSKKRVRDVRQTYKIVKERGNNELGKRA